MEQRLEAVTTDLTKTENVVRRKSEALESAENKSQEYQRKAERADILQNELLVMFLYLYAYILFERILLYLYNVS